MLPLATALRQIIITLEDISIRCLPEGLVTDSLGRLANKRTVSSDVSYPLEQEA